MLVLVYSNISFVDVCSTLTLPKIVIEDFSQVDVHQVSADISQSSQLTNDQIDINPVRPIIPPVEKTTPVRVSYRMNPDGSRVSISRPGVTSTHASPMAALRRVRLSDKTHVSPINVSFQLF